MSFKPTDYLPYDFANRRHIGPSPKEMAEMLSTVGAADLDTLIDETVPKGIRQAAPWISGNRNPSASCCTTCARRRRRTRF